MGIDQSGYITLAFSGMTNRVMNQKWLHKSCLWARENTPLNKLSILSINTWGDLFYQPLQMGHQNFLARVAPANFAILACTMIGAF